MLDQPERGDHKADIRLWIMTIHHAPRASDRRGTDILRSRRAVLHGTGLPSECRRLADFSGWVHLRGGPAAPPPRHRVTGVR